MVLRICTDWQLSLLASLPFCDMNGTHERVHARALMMSVRMCNMMYEYAGYVYARKEIHTDIS